MRRNELKELDTSFGASPLASSGKALCFRLHGQVWWKGQKVQILYRGGKKPWLMTVGNIPSDRAIIFNLTNRRRILLMAKDIVSISEVQNVR